MTTGSGKTSEEYTIDFWEHVRQIGRRMGIANIPVADLMERAAESNDPAVQTMLAEAHKCARQALISKNKRQ